ncbi:unnamed protein product [Cyprideis torosa]|uniref:Uncharacterized protein n=1 Tax=Cyprideis torosa TaxID=163714 RepID=A0A7R8W845_9CRUS|nr:unnamed protein product [Cyprideis torosa]CAG0882831.1 unnamed protein product [Cyprideis torosa]
MSLLAGLMYYRPEDPVGFIEYCIGKIKEGSLNRLEWNSFVDYDRDVMVGILKEHQTQLSCAKCGHIMSKFLPRSLAQHMPTPISQLEDRCMRTSQISESKKHGVSKVSRGTMTNVTEEHIMNPPFKVQLTLQEIPGGEGAMVGLAGCLKSAGIALETPKMDDCLQSQRVELTGKQPRKKPSTYQPTVRRGGTRTLGARQASLNAPSAAKKREPLGTKRHSEGTAMKDLPNQEPPQQGWKQQNEKRRIVKEKPESKSLQLPPRLNNLKGIHYSVPKAAVIFVIGGPGSGKVYHCTRLSEQLEGLIHLNVSEILLQHAAKHGFKNVEVISPSVLVGMVMMEMVMSPEAEVFVITGFPRNMDDLMDYAQKIVRVDGAVLIDWEEESLKRQVEYGAKLGEVDFKVAMRELQQFFENVIPVTHFLKNKKLLHEMPHHTAKYSTVTGGAYAVVRLVQDKTSMGQCPWDTVEGERHPNEVFEDVATAVAEIVDSLIPDSLELQQFFENVIPVTHFLKNKKLLHENVTVAVEVHSGSESDPDEIELPPTIFVLGGPGSDKSKYSEQVVPLFPGWIHVPLGRLLRSMLESYVDRLSNSTSTSNLSRTNDITMAEDLPFTEENIKEAFLAYKTGNAVNEDLVCHVLNMAMEKHPNATGLIIDGFPRTQSQLKQIGFTNGKNKFKVILLDSSEMELQRNLNKRSGRSDDTLQTARRKMTWFREETVPVLREIDAVQPLLVVDRDCEDEKILRNMKQQVHRAVQKLIPPKSSLKPRLQALRDELKSAKVQTPTPADAEEVKEKTEDEEHQQDEIIDVDPDEHIRIAIESPSSSPKGDLSIHEQEIPAKEIQDNKSELEAVEIADEILESTDEKVLQKQTSGESIRSLNGAQVIARATEDV